MKKSCLFLLIISVLSSLNIYLYFNFKSFKDKTSAYLEATKNDNEKTLILQTNIEASIQNVGRSLKNTILKDSCNKNQQLSHIQIKNQYLLICYFSESDCESCINYSIQTLLPWCKSTGYENILFIGQYRHNKLFYEQLPLYNLKPTMAYNSYGLNLPLKDLGYPFYLIVDDSYNVVEVYIPNKGNPNTDQYFLQLLTTRFFPKEIKQP